jgi:large subunit ribosomal protein L27
MAHTKAKGTTKLGRDSESKRLGVKIYGGSPIKCGQIIIRQRGTAYMAGDNVKTGKDDTLYATADGTVQFKKVRYANFNGNKKMKQIVSVTKTESTAKPAKNETEIEKPQAFNEEVKLEKLSAENEESLNAKSKSQYIKEEQPIKSIPQKKETKK